MHGAFLIFFAESNTFKKTIRSKIPHLCHTPQGEPERQRRQPPKSAGEFQRILCGLTSSPRANSHFLIIRSESGVLHIGGEADDASYCGTIVKQCFIWKGGLWSTASPYEAQLALHEAALRAMKRSLFRLHVFLPGIRAKKWGGRPDSNRRPPGPQPGALTNWATSTILYEI